MHTDNAERHVHARQCIQTMRITPGSNFKIASDSCDSDVSNCAISNGQKKYDAEIS